MPLFQVTSKPANGKKPWMEGDIRREAIRVTILEAEDEAEAKVRVNDSNRAVAEETDSGLYKVTKVAKV